MPKLLSDRTAARLMTLLNGQEGAGPARRGHAQARWAFVRCDSAAAVGGDPVLDQCYPATILRPAADYPAPPEEAFPCLLTVLGAGGESVTPVAGVVYEALLTAEVEGDRSGSGSAVVSGRPRAVAVTVGDFFGPDGGVVDGEVVAFDGATGKIGKASGVVVFGPLDWLDTPAHPDFPAFGLKRRLLTVHGSDTLAASNGRAALYAAKGAGADPAAAGLNLYTNGPDDAAALPSTGYTVEAYGLGTNDNLCTTITQTFTLRSSSGVAAAAATIATTFVGGSTTALLATCTNLKIKTNKDVLVSDSSQGFVLTAPSTNEFRLTVTNAGVLQCGGVAVGGDIYSGVSNTFTSTNTFQSPGASSVPVVVRGATGQTADLLDFKDSFGAVVASVSANGTFTGNGSGLTNLNANNLSSGTVPFARTAPDLLSLAAAYGG